MNSAAGAALLATLCVMGISCQGDNAQGPFQMKARGFDEDGQPQFRHSEQALTCSFPISQPNELMIRDLSVVNDPVRTTWTGSLANPQDGAWTFGRLMANMAGNNVPEDFVRNWLASWETPQVVNGFTIPARPAITSQLINPWPKLANGKLDLTRAPMRLLAIVNRMDLRDLPNGSAGEGRFVFGVTDSFGNPQLFTVIFEYRLPAQTQQDVIDWAKRWHNLGSLPIGSAAFNTALQDITDRFAGKNVAPGLPNGSAINQVRTDEIAIGSPWQLREFRLDPATGALKQSTVALTPANAVNNTTLLGNFLSTNQSVLLAGTAPAVPLQFQAANFRGGASDNNFGEFWNSPDPAFPDAARHEFAMNTCNGCHGAETGMNNGEFTHVHNRGANQVAQLSGFLTGMSIADPKGVVHSFNDLQRRATDLSNLLCTQPVVSITAPASGASVSGSVAVSATADDQAGIAKVDFFDGPALIGTATTTPFTVAWNTATAAPGAHTLTAKATNTGGVATTSAGVTVVVNTDTTPPTTSLTAPANGAVVAGTVVLRANASDNVGVVRVDFLDGTTVLGNSTVAPFTFNWNTSGLPPGSVHSLTSRAVDASGNTGTSAAVSVTLATAGQAAFDATRGAPVCMLLAGQCDSGALLTGRANLGPEVHASNTLSASLCADGTGGSFHADESLDGIKIIRTDGTNLAAGKQVNVVATVWAFSSNDWLDIYTASNADSPAWTYVTSVRANGSGPQTLTVPVVLPAGGLQAIRANFRYVGSALPCTTGIFDDHDDVVFAVGSEPDALPPTVAISGPANGATVGPSTLFTATASDNFGVTKVEYYDGANLIGSATYPPFGITWNVASVPAGSHTLTSKAYDLAGNKTTSAPITVNVDNTPPATAVTAPVNGATVVGTVTLQANATDASGVSRVEYYVDSALYSTSFTAPYSVSWNSRSFANGTHTIFTKAYDSLGNVGQSASVTVTTNNDFTPPSVTLTAPAVGATVLGTVSLQATASDNTGVARVEFYVDGVLAGTSTAAPYSVAWNSRSVANGSHSVLAMAVDLWGNTATMSVGITTNNDFIPPTVSVTAPTDGTVAVGTISLQAAATDNLAVAKVEFSVDSVVVGTVTASPYSMVWSSRTVPNGTHTVTAKAYDPEGNTAQASVTITTNNDFTPPTAAVTAPTAGSTLTGTVTVTATASDNLSVNRVEFYVDTLYIGSSYSAPYAIAWNSRNVSNGAHTLSTKAYDNAGNMGQSAGVSVTTNNDFVPPTATLTAPANGALLTGTVTLTATASDNLGAIARVDFYQDSALIGSSTAAPYTLVWNSATGPNGPATLTARAVDAAGNVGSSAPISVSVNNANNNAYYDTVLKAPRCDGYGPVCDSTTLAIGRAGLGPEVHASNTINSSCPDGTGGAFHSDESLDGLKVSTVTGGLFYAGTQMKIEATVWAWAGFSSDAVDFYYAADANNPVWIYIGTVVPTKAGAQVLSTTYTLPSSPTLLQAVRANFRYVGSASPCSTGAFDDRDDLIFRTY